MKHKYLAGLALGLTLGFIASSIIYWLLDETSGVVQKFISEQITHVVTLSAAALALFGVSTQIQSNFTVVEKTRLAKLDAAKAILPIVLSNISRLCEERVHSIARGESDKPDGVKWEITDAELQTLKECTEYADGVEKELILQIFRVYQVLISRWESLEFDNLFQATAVTEGDGLILARYAQFGALSNWATLRAICIALFDFSRGAHSAPTSNVMKDEVLKTLDRINTGGPNGGGGAVLRNNVDFANYLERKEENRRIEFIEDDWY